MSRFEPLALWDIESYETTSTLLQRDGVIERLGENCIYDNIYEAAADPIPDDTL